VDSDEVQSEWRSALDEKKIVVPILYQLCDVPYRLKPIQYIDFTSCSPDDEKSLEQVLRALGIAGSALIEPLAQSEQGQDKASYWFDKGYDLDERQGKYDEAIQAYDKAIQTDNDVGALFNKGFVLNKLRRYDEAIKAFNKYIQINPEDAFAWSYKGSALDNLGNYAEAIKAHDKAIKIDPKNALAWTNKGSTLDNLGNYAEAIKAYDKAIKIDPKNALAWYRKGTALKLLGKTSESNAAYVKAKELGCTD
jgi:tetratricopeptide (TPR) repeat protein